MDVYLRFWLLLSLCGQRPRPLRRSLETTPNTTPELYGELAISSVRTRSRQMFTLANNVRKPHFVQHLLQKHHSTPWRNLFTGKAYRKIYHKISLMLSVRKLQLFFIEKS